jgi:hypothetical protein
VYGITGEPNFEERYIPLLSKSLADLAAERKMTDGQLHESLEGPRTRLLELRSERTRPLTDTKILAGWNGLAIRGLADAGRIFGNEAYTAAAARAAKFVLANMRDAKGRLMRSFAGGKARLLGYLDDYAYLVDGLIALHQATGDSQWLEAADALMADQIELFADPRIGGFFYTSTEHEELIARSKLPVDGVTPSGNSVSVTNLLYLADVLDRPDYVERAEGCLKSGAPVLEERPAAVPYLALALSAWLDAARGDDSTGLKK